MRLLNPALRPVAIGAALAPVLLATLAPPAMGQPGEVRVRGAGGPPAAPARAGEVGAAALLDRVRDCEQISRGKYRADPHKPADIPVCAAQGAVFWKADIDIDCDGRRTRRCNGRTDPYFQPSTAFRTSRGEYLDSAALPFVVVPASSRIWNYRKSKVTGGTVAAVIYRDRVRYAVVGDVGPAKVIGEASYALAKRLGIPPNPAGGGTADDVTYILFPNIEVEPIESHRAAERAGSRAAREFVGVG